MACVYVALLLLQSCWRMLGQQHGDEGLRWQVHAAGPKRQVRGGVVGWGLGEGHNPQVLGCVGSVGRWGQRIRQPPPAQPTEACRPTGVAAAVEAVGGLGFAVAASVSSGVHCPRWSKAAPFLRARVQLPRRAAVGTGLGACRSWCGAQGPHRVEWPVW